MLPIPSNVKLVVGTLLVALIAAGGYLLKNGVELVWIAPVLSALVYIDGLLTTPTKVQAELDGHVATINRLSAKLADKVGVVFVFLALACARLRGLFAAVLFLGLSSVGFVTLAGCPQAGAVAAPALSCVSAVLADALAGMNVDDIVAKEKGLCVKDAAEVLTILLGSDDPSVKASRAFGEARSRRAASPGTVRP